MVELLGNLESW